LSQVRTLLLTGSISYSTRLLTQTMIRAVFSCSVLFFASLPGLDAQNPTAAPSTLPIGSPTSLPSIGTVTDAPVVFAETDIPSQESENVTDETPSAAPSDPLDIEIPACFTNLTILDDVLLQLPLFEFKKLTLCPNTIFDIGKTSDGICCIEGQFPLLPVSNTLIQCGEDGRSENNCIFSGGEVHVLSSPQFAGPTALNVTIKGMTFRNPLLSNAVLASRGDITFDDCIFENTASLGGSVVALYQPIDDEEARRLEEEERGGIFRYMDPEFLSRRIQKTQANIKENFAKVKAENELRKLQGTNSSIGVLERQFVTVENCVFRDNSQGPISSGFFQSTVLSASTPFIEMTIRNTLFYNNIFDGSKPMAASGAVVKTASSALRLENNCFIANSFVGFAPVQAFENTTFDAFDNFGSFDPGVSCEFIAFSEGIPVSDSQVACTRYDLDSCLLPDAPTLPPGADSITPTPAPTRAAAAGTPFSVHYSLKMLVVLLPVFWLI
jgi:hypothetical protein